jgi:putative heme-binding domain-containing protein
MRDRDSDQNLCFHLIFNMTSFFCFSANLKRLSVFGLVLLGLGWSDARGAQPGSVADLPSPDVAAEKAGFVVPEGFEIDLFASEPMIQKPVQMNWDSAGRLWVVSSTTYPHIEVGAAAADQVVVLEDTDGDGKADKSTVFAEGLHIPTAVIPGDGGAYVANSTELIFLKDTNGDLKADEKTILLSGFGTEDTHHLLHTLRFGPEGLLYFLQSIYIHSHIETPHGVRRLMGGGVWEFRPETRRLEVLSKGLINPWGFEFDRWGQSFAVDGAGSEGVNFIFPFSVFATSPGAPRILKGLSPGQPKHSGLEIIEEPHFPADWQGSFVCCDFRGNRINRFQLERSGSSYVAKQMPDVLASNHRAFRPIDVKVGPDGALYIADWYNPIIQHGEVDFRDPRRDHVHGRIWRLRAKGRPMAERPAIAGAAVEPLLELLKSDRRWVRQFARLELRQRGPDAVVPALTKWVEGLKAGSPEEAHALLEAAWVREGLNAFSPELWRALWSSSDARIRAAALRILSHRWREIEGVAGIVTKGIEDADAQVRLWAMSVCALIRKPAYVEIALKAVDQPMDESLDFLLEQICRDQADAWLPVFLAGKLKLNGNSKHLVYALRATGRSEALPPLFDAMAGGRLEPADVEAVLRAAGESMDPARAAQLASLAGVEALVNHRMQVLDALIRAAEARKVIPKGAESILRPWLATDDPVIAARAARLAGLWKVEAVRGLLAEWLPKAELSMEVRQAAMKGLADLGGVASRDLFDRLFAEQTDAATRALMVEGLIQTGPQLAVKRAVEYLTGARTAAEAGPLMSVLLQNKKLPELLSRALDGKTLAPAVAVEAIRMTSTRGVAGSLVDALKKAGGVKQMDRALTADEMADLVAKVASQGSAARGEAIYRRQQLLCITCHAIGDAGGVLGPNLVSIGGSAPVDYLIESLMEPSKKIKEGYHMVMVSTKSGQVFSGGLVKDSPTEVIIRDPANQLQTVSKADIASQQMSPVSMMPAGLTASLREDEFVDLVRFLSELGREGAYKISPKRFVRSWQGMGAMQQPEIDYVRHVGLHSLNDLKQALPWQPMTALVSGELPLDELVPAQRMYPWHPRIARFSLNMAAAGPVKLRLSAVAGLVVVVGSEQIQDLKEEVTLDLAKGVTPVSLLATKEAQALNRLSVEIVEGTAQVVP